MYNTSEEALTRKLMEEVEKGIHDNGIDDHEINMIIEALDFKYEIAPELDLDAVDILHEQIWNGDLDSVAELRSMIQEAAEKTATAEYKRRMVEYKRQRLAEAHYEKTEL